ncbi:hypothetical protein Slin15195_G115570 [Septoria linicola]|uniref:Uncharacterized protein n=1 Tax=Septoria linicola TaxID=215465 RepID=A0A9Q9B3F8_9PEZI|nr:hypothetical protein Slin14017_G092580 [Septoria linicola]USW58238.1 hypothetical protein Slin15195_G115570 [Septoria linicola]
MGQVIDESCEASNAHDLAAAQAVFSTYETLEPLKSFDNAIKRSIYVQEKLFFKPLALTHKADSLPSFAPLWISAKVDLMRAGIGCFFVKACHPPSVCSVGYLSADMRGTYAGVRMGRIWEMFQRHVEHQMSSRAFDEERRAEKEEWDNLAPDERQRRIVDLEQDEKDRRSRKEPCRTRNMHTRQLLGLPPVSMKVILDDLWASQDYRLGLLPKSDSGTGRQLVPQAQNEARL